MNNIGDIWVETYNGGKLHLAEPRFDEITIEDIAHSLSLLCRFTGHCSKFYSVAQHSIYVSQILDDKDKLAGLLHDASETYTGDMNRPMKSLFRAFKPIENIIQDAIYRRFGIHRYDHTLIKRADNIMLATEARDLMKNSDDWGLTEEPLKGMLEPWDSSYAEIMFLSSWEEIRGIVGCVPTTGI